MLILSTHSLNALTCSGESSDSSIVDRSALRERSISFLVNRKQITLTQRGENLLRPIALVIRSFMRCLLTASGGDLKLGYNTRGEDLCDYFAIEFSKGRLAWAIRLSGNIEVGLSACRKSASSLPEAAYHVKVAFTVIRRLRRQLCARSGRLRKRSSSSAAKFL